MMAFHFMVAVACAASAFLIPFGYFIDRRIGKKASMRQHAFSGAVFVANATLAIYNAVKAFEASL